ncbi:rhamnose-binding lectin-like [Chaetodon auriga]|uniref:rhamnose-binding lectin-like n=1 Tax=Chaetodon auriga TaxID=39042 RepID=UPI004032DD4F
MLCFRLSGSTLLLAATCWLMTAGVSTETVISCDNGFSVQRLHCDDGVISVQAALYGRADSRTCSEGRPPQQLTNTRCSQPGTVDILRRRCDGKKVCELTTSAVRSSDPCYGTFKYLETNYTCLPAIRLVVCEHSSAHLFCDKGQVISVYGADYGRRDRTTCSYKRPASQIQNVYCSDPASKVAKSCNGKNRCTIRASNSVFGDPCVGTYKYLEVAYTCEYPLFLGSTSSQQDLKRASDIDSIVTKAQLRLNFLHQLRKDCQDLHSGHKHLQSQETSLQTHHTLNTTCYIFSPLGGVCSSVPSTITKTRYPDNMFCSRLSASLLLAATCLLMSAGFSRAQMSGHYVETALSTHTAITCEDFHNVQRLSCDDGVISVQAALYGRADGQTCSEGRPPQQLTNTGCSQPGTADVLRRSCDGRKVCELNISDVHTSDPCFGIYKYLETTYRCIPATHVTACEHSLMNLQCDEGQVIFVIGADYGRRDQTTCSYRRPAAQIHNVYCSRPTSKVAESCNGKRSCAIKASNSVFGDPCFGTYKYLEVSYRCQYAETEPRH